MKILPGTVWKHVHGLRYRIDSIGLNVTGYEKGRKLFPRFVVYTQLDDGKFPKGTVWVRSEKDFLGKTMVNGRSVNNFELIR